MPDMRERVARRSARSGYAVPDGRVSAQRRRVTHEGTPDARAVRRVWSGPAPLLLRANGALRRALRLSLVVEPEDGQPPRRQGPDAPGSRRPPAGRRDRGHREQRRHAALVLLGQEPLPSRRRSVGRALARRLSRRQPADRGFLLGGPGPLRAGRPEGADRHVDRDVLRSGAAPRLRLASALQGVPRSCHDPQARAARAPGGDPRPGEQRAGLRRLHEGQRDPPVHRHRSKPAPRDRRSERGQVRVRHAGDVDPDHLGGGGARAQAGLLSGLPVALPRRPRRAGSGVSGGGRQADVSPPLDRGGLDVTSMTPSRLLIFVPTYNENRNVERLCAELRALPLDADILFIDDGSPDGTGATLDRLARQHPRVSVIHREGKLGIGSAHRAGIAYAYEKGYDLLITLDADFSHSPADLPRLLAAHARDVDVGVASRYLGPDSLPGWSPHRLFLTRFGHFLTRVLLRMPYDASGALRLYDLRRIPRELFELVTARAYPFFFESLFILCRNGARIREIPIVLQARVYGSSKLTAREGVRSGRFLLRLFFAQLANPGRFRRSRPIDRLRPELVESQGWDEYWSEKRTALGTLYDLVAAVYRRVIRRNLRRDAERSFASGARSLHARRSSRQVDAGLHERFRVTAVDISERALRLYARNNPHASRIEQASIFDLPFEAGAFDGVYNLGVLEHFHPHEIREILDELPARVLLR